MTERRYVSKLSVDDAYYFMVGFETLTKAEKNIVIYFIEHDYEFKGTYTNLAKDMGKDETYIAEINKACRRLSDKNLLEISEPLAWYYRHINLNKNWIDKLIAIGKDHANVQ